MNTFIISFITKKNCLFRKYDYTTMLVVQQIVLLVVMSVLFGESA